MNGFIRIISAPRGEAPLWVRQAWIGLELPLAAPAVVDLPTTGVLSGRRLWNRMLGMLRLAPTQQMAGYLVDRATAVNLLHCHAPEAAAWWRANVPEAMRRDSTCFLFDSNCGQRLAANDDTPP